MSALLPFRLRDLRSPACTQRLSLGCPHLDALVKGGIPVGCLTEVVGELKRGRKNEQLHESTKNERKEKTHPRPFDLFQKKQKKGEATAGKTQLCLRLLLTAQLPESEGGLDGSALWLCSEKGAPPVRRLAQLAANSGGNRPSDPPSAAAAPAAASPRSRAAAAPSTDNVFVEKGLFTPLELMEVLDRMEPLMMATTATADDAGGGGNGGRRSNRKRIRLIVVDSIAALFRDAAAATDDAASADRTRAIGGGGVGGGKEAAGGGGTFRSLYAARAAALFAVAARLKRLADDHSLVVVVVNQVTDVIAGDDLGEGIGGARAPSALLSASSSSSLSRGKRPPPPTHTAGLRLVSSGREVAPALGLAWASCVGIRLFLSRAAPVGSSFGGGAGGGGSDENIMFPPRATAAAAAATATRCLQVVFAPHLPPSYCLATVCERGLVGVPAVDDEMGGKRQKPPPPLPHPPRKQQPSQPAVVCNGVFADG